jgi:uncharacterized protein YpuA (DUF1002 family)
MMTMVTMVTTVAAMVARVAMSRSLIRTARLSHGHTSTKHLLHEQLLQVLENWHLRAKLNQQTAEGGQVVSGSHGGKADGPTRLSVSSSK